MEIKRGKTVSNRTSAYLAPIIQMYHKVFRSKLLELKRVAWGIGDSLYKELNDCKYHLFLLVENDKLAQFLPFFRECKYYGDDYKYDNNYHILVIKMEDRFHKAYDKFLDSRYSEMYSLFDTKRIINRYIDGKPNPVFYILTRDEKYETIFQDILRKEFNLDITPDVTDREYDFPLDLKEEIFNYADSQRLPT